MRMLCVLVAALAACGPDFEDEVEPETDEEYVVGEDVGGGDEAGDEEDLSSVFYFERL